MSDLRESFQKSPENLENQIKNFRKILRNTCFLKRIRIIFWEISRTFSENLGEDFENYFGNF